MCRLSTVAAITAAENVSLKIYIEPEFPLNAADDSVCTQPYRIARSHGMERDHPHNVSNHFNKNQIIAKM